MGSYTELFTGSKLGNLADKINFDLLSP